jgi:hypothetical protein
VGRVSGALVETLTSPDGLNGLSRVDHSSVLSAVDEAPQRIGVHGNFINVNANDAGVCH